MGIVLAFLLLFFCMLAPPILIYRSPSPTGWRKAAWFLGCLLSAFAPVLISKIMVQFGGFELNAATLVYMAPLNAAMFGLPWLVYVIFKGKQANNRL